MQCYSVVMEKKWPKTFPPLTPELEIISNDFMKYWHEVLPKRFGLVNRFNHNYVLKNPHSWDRTLEIGAGDGEHLFYEELNDDQFLEYHAMDIRKNMVDELKQKFPLVNTIVADCEKTLPFSKDYFERVIAIHVLEHLPNLPKAVEEIYRVCNKNTGFVSVVIPCEGSLAYWIARKISAERIFKKRYKMPYTWFIKREHVNVPNEIFEELLKYFEVVSKTFFPLPIPIQTVNLCIGIKLRPKNLEKI